MSSTLLLTRRRVSLRFQRDRPAFAIAEETMTTNRVLLTGAGFSKNWGGRLAREVTNDLMSRLQDNQHLLQLLNRANFEDVLAHVQGEYIQSRMTQAGQL
jgi:hypothetical protein